MLVSKPLLNYNIMKKRVLFLFILFTVFLNNTIMAQKTTSTYADSWKKVEQYATKQQPESGLKEVESILNDASKAGNFAETVKAYIYKMRFTLDKNPGDAPAVIKDFELFSEKYTGVSDKALLHSMIAELYAMYYNSNQYIVNQRTQIEGFTPENINEWSKNIFFDKISSEIKLSLNDAAVLQKADLSRYTALLEQGKNDKEYQPTLYDFLGQRAIDILTGTGNIALVRNPLNNPQYFSPVADFVKMQPENEYVQSAENLIISIYQQLLAFRQSESNTAALIYIDLRRLDFVRSNSDYYNSDELYFNAMQNLKTRYASQEEVIEVIAKIAEYYQSRYRQNGQESNNNKLAYDAAQEGIDRFPKAANINRLKNIQAYITQKNVQVNYAPVVKPGSIIKFDVQSKNISNLQIIVYRVNATAQEYYNFMQNRNSSNDVYSNRKLVETIDWTVKPDENFNTVKNQFTLQAGDYGIYEFVIKEKGSTVKDEWSTGTFTATDFAFMQRKIQKELTDIYVVDRVSGKPVADVSSQSFYYEWDGRKTVMKPAGNYKSDTDGLIQFKGDRYSYVHFFTKGSDRYFSSASNNYFYENNTKNEAKTLALFTDRSIYRPGQTVYFKGIAYSQNDQKVLTNTSYEVTLLDANYQKVASKTFKTNEFGSFSGEFVLPQSGLNGAYQLASTNMSLSIFVEEYKRPTFEVDIPKTEKEVHFGEQFTFTGNARAYAGYNLPNAQVQYTITRQTHRLFRLYFTPDRIVASGATTTDAQGKFEVPFTPEKTRENSFMPFRDQFYTYVITVNITDSKGETQVGTQSISVGDKSLFIIADAKDKYQKENTIELPVSTQTLNGKTISSIVNYTIYELENSDMYLEDMPDTISLKTAKSVQSGKFNTEDKILKLDLKSRASGRYKIVFTTSDSQGKEVKIETTFILYSTTDRRPPVKTYTWLMPQRVSVAVGENAVIAFGTSTDATVLYEILQGNTVLESKWVKLNNEIKQFDIPYKKAYGDGVVVSFTFIKDERLFTTRQQITLKAADKKLTPALSVFRNKLQPGEKADWTVTIPEAADKKLVAELMVSMYDASLDAIREHSWMFNPAGGIDLLYSPSWTATGLSKQYTSAYFPVKTQKINPLQLSSINWFGLGFNNYGLRIRGKGMMRSNMEANDEVLLEMVSEDTVTGAIPAPAMSKQAGYMDAGVAENQSSQSESQNQVQVRTNFNETAFFYPQLRTDKEGNVKFTFTVPESLTRWNVMMLAHTPDLYFGQSQEQVVTQKDLMVQLNMPRFVRRSDKLTLSANVINLTENTLTANVNFQLVNPENEQAIKLKDSGTRTVTLAPGETKAVEWKITEFTGHELLIAKVTAQAGAFSDGEQHYLPVLPDKVMITESMPMTIRGNQTRNFTFENLVNQGKKLDTKSIVVEFASNPTWYAVQALPTYASPENENAIDYFTAYYVNGLASYIANSNPKLSTMLERWRREGGSKEALLSNLEKNTELKNILLEETPWVLAAKDESEQKRTIALLFDLNKQASQSQQYMDKLIKLQKASGGFAWFDGMSENRYITQQILLGMAQYYKMTDAPADMPAWIAKALEYTDLQIAKDYADLKKNNKDYRTKMVIRDLQWFYLHMRSEYKTVPVNALAKEAVDFYTSQAEKYWTDATLYGKAASALINHRNGKSSIANEIIKSLKENAMKTDDLGMYWARNTAGYFWNERPIGVQTAILEAFAEITGNTTDIDEMKIWLLKQKQTQRWDSPVSTVDAIYALLNYGTDWLASEGDVEIKLNNKKLEPASKEAGTGYFKETITGSDINPKMGNVTVTKKDAGIGWGAMYWQYYQDVDKVQAQGGALSVTKKLFVENTVNNATTMVPIEQTQVKKGDKVITRLVVTTDRNLEFVALKDLRAACFEPLEQISHMVWREGVSYYQTTKDASTQFFFNYLPTGTYTFEYETWANNAGEFSNGMATIQCQYAPEFISHSASSKVIVE